MALLLAGMAAAIWGIQHGLGVLLGGVIGLALTFQAGFRTLAEDARTNPRAVLRALYRGEAKKILLAVVLFGLVAAWWPSRFLQVIVGYAATLAVFWLAMLRYR